jgi:hypothetical protein
MRFSAWTLAALGALASGVMAGLPSREEALAS